MMIILQLYICRNHHINTGTIAHAETAAKVWPELLGCSFAEAASNCEVAFLACLPQSDCAAFFLIDFLLLVCMSSDLTACATHETYLP